MKRKNLMLPVLLLALCPLASCTEDATAKQDEKAKLNFVFPDKAVYGSWTAIVGDKEDSMKGYDWRSEGFDVGKQLVISFYNVNNVILSAQNSESYYYLKGLTWKNPEGAQMKDLSAGKVLTYQMDYEVLAEDNTITLTSSGLINNEKN